MSQFYIIRRAAGMRNVDYGFRAFPGYKVAARSIARGVVGSLKQPYSQTLEGIEYIDDMEMSDAAKAYQSQCELTTSVRLQNCFQLQMTATRI